MVRGYEGFWCDGGRGGSGRGGCDYGRGGGDDDDWVMIILAGADIDNCTGIVYISD